MPVSMLDDKVWFDETTKLQQACNDVEGARLDGRSVLLLSYFEATLSRLSTLLQEKGISHDRFSALNPAELCASSSGKVWLGSALAFHVGQAASPAGAGKRLEIIVAEHHPMQSRDQQVVDSAKRLTCEGRLCFHFSLDDPVMKHFGSETIKALYERLGIPKDECISHHLVTRAIRTAQEKIESQVGRDVPTHSAEDWFKYNLTGKK
jgi:preprotein translocase subunit SecA